MKVRLVERFGFDDFEDTEIMEVIEKVGEARKSLVEAMNLIDKLTKKYDNNMLEDYKDDIEDVENMVEGVDYSDTKKPIVALRTAYGWYDDSYDD